MNPLTPDQYIIALRNDLKKWVEDRKGYLSIAGDVGELLEFLTDKPRTFRVVLNYAGDKNRVEEGGEEAAIGDVSFEVFLVKSKGLRLTPGEHLIQAAGGDDVAFLKLVSDLRDRVRSITWPSDITYQHSLYKEGAWVDLGSQSEVVAYRLTFELIAAFSWSGYRDTSSLFTES
jgi:hypothetical protein